MHKRKHYAGLAAILVLVAMTTACPNGTKNLATASDAIAHALANAQTASKQAAAQEVISQAEDAQFQGYLSKVAQAGLILDQGIRANESATTLSPKVNAFLDAFNQLQNAGLAGIKNQSVRLTLSSAIIGAEASVAVIAQAVGK